MREEKKTYLWWKYLDMTEVGWRKEKKQKKRVKLFFIQNEQDLEKGKNKGEWGKERRKRRQSNTAASWNHILQK